MNAVIVSGFKIVLHFLSGRHPQRIHIQPIEKINPASTGGFYRHCHPTRSLLIRIVGFYKPVFQQNAAYGIVIGGCTYKPKSSGIAAVFFLFYRNLRKLIGNTHQAILQCICTQRPGMPRKNSHGFSAQTCHAIGKDCIFCTDLLSFSGLNYFNRFCIPGPETPGDAASFGQLKFGSIAKFLRTLAGIRRIHNQRLSIR